MSPLTQDPYLSHYISVSEALSGYVQQMTATPELVRDPEAAFDTLHALVIKSGPPADYTTTAFVPEILNAKLSFARGCLELYLRNNEEAERCFESALCYADLVEMRTQIVGWIDEHLPQGSSYTIQIGHLMKNAQHNVSFDTATFSERDWTDYETDFDISSVHYAAELDLALEPDGTREHGVGIDPVNLTSEIDTIVNAVSKSADRGLIVELFEQAQARFIAGAKFSECVSSDDIGLIDAKLNVLGALIDVTNPVPACTRDEIDFALLAASQRAEFWGCLRELLEWKRSQAVLHPALAEFLL